MKNTPNNIKRNNDDVYSDEATEDQSLNPQENKKSKLTNDFFLSFSGTRNTMSLDGITLNNNNIPTNFSHITPIGFNSNNFFSNQPLPTYTPINNPYNDFHNSFSNNNENRNNSSGNDIHLNNIFKSDLTDFQINTSIKNKSFYQNINSPKIIEKGKVIEILEKLILSGGEKITDKVLVDITYRNNTSEVKITTMGRENVKGSSKKQMRHVIPYVFIENLVESVITSKPSKATLTSLIKVLKILIKNKPGYCFSSQDFKESGYEELSTQVPQATKKILRSDSFDSFFVSPKKLLSSKTKSFTPNKQNKAKKSYGEYYPKYTELIIEKLANFVKDSNTATMIAEAIIRITLGFYNKKDGTAFPEEGNTQNFQIRLYESKNDTLSPKGKNYKVVSAKDLKELYKTESISQKIRLVNCEGDSVKKILKSIKGLNDIVKNHYTTNKVDNQIKNYNNIKPLKLVLANNNNGLEEYNKQLTPENYLTQTMLELAKLIYFAFDFKALEKVVLVKDKKGIIELYNGAKSNAPIKYSFSEGNDYRTKEKKSAKGYNGETKFRDDKDVDLIFLEHKLIEHFVISTMPYSEFVTGFFKKDNFLETTLKALIKLVSIDYELSPTKEEDLLVSANNYYSELTTDKLACINIFNSQAEDGLLSEELIFESDNSNIINSQPDINNENSNDISAIMGLNYPPNFGFNYDISTIMGLNYPPNFDLNHTHQSSLYEDYL